MHAANPKLLIFVEGVSSNCHPAVSRDAGWWGGCLCAAGARYYPASQTYSDHSCHMKHASRLPCALSGLSACE